MAGGNRSKDKGSTAERELCKIFGKIFEASFIRSNNSGAFIGGKNSFRKAALSQNQLTGVKGDIVPPDHMPRLVIESKHYKEFPYHQLIGVGSVSLLDDWIQQTLDVVDPDDFWLVAFKANRKPWSVCIVDTDRFVCSNYSIYRRNETETYRIMDLLTFLENNKETILELSKPIPVADPN